MNQRIVINRCYGGFGLSNLAAKRYRELAWIPEGIKWHIADYDGMEHIAEDHRQWGLDEYPKEEVQEELFPTIRYASFEKAQEAFKKTNE